MHQELILMPKNKETSSQNAKIGLILPIVIGIIVGVYLLTDMVLRKVSTVCCFGTYRCCTRPDCGPK